MGRAAWVISVNMGYGHQRTAYPLRRFVPSDKVINANDYDGIPENDRRIWETARKFYEAISRFSRTPLIGRAVFSTYDHFQRIFAFYPKRDLSKPNFILKRTYSLFKKGWGKHLIEQLKDKSSEFSALSHASISGKLKTDLPIISTFFTPAFMAEFFNYPGEIFCVICDADIARTWAPLCPQKSKIKYFAPTERVVERLKLYGVPPKNIFLTGFPLPLENIGSEKMEILKDDLRYRLLNLDPEGKYCEKYKSLIEASLGKLPAKSDHPLTLMFSVGGAGVQKEIALNLVRSLAKEINEGKIKIILSAGIREKVKRYFVKEIYGGTQTIPPIETIYGENIESYFEKFNFALRKTDILWTKPSELSFYSALGIPIIIAPPVGSQEEFNMRWLLKSGFGLSQQNPVYANQWLFDWISAGYLAEAAMEGFIEGQKLGTYKIAKVLNADLLLK